MSFKVGDKVALARDVERFPSFIARKGATGTVCRIDTDSEGGIWDMAVRMDETIAGCEEWNNEIYWTDEYLDDINEDLVKA